MSTSSTSPYCENTSFTSSSVVLNLARAKNSCRLSCGPEEANGSSYFLVRAYRTSNGFSQPGKVICICSFAIACEASSLEHIVTKAHPREVPVALSVRT
eukprot:9491963-Pyramimonas_sp.AAC.1